MARNQLPEGVGKKIVEALKRQAEADIAPASQAELTADSVISETETAGFNDADFADFKEAAPAAKTEAAPAFEIKFKDEPAAPAETIPSVQPASFDFQNKKDEAYQPKDSFANTMFNVQNKREDFFAQPVQDAYTGASFSMQQKNTAADSQTAFKSSNETAGAMTFSNQASASGMLSYSGIPFNEEQKINAAAPVVSVSIPTNVAVLKNLIASLPVGVTKQTGAQIIRQTLEAMGLPMASVLKEAQEVQEELNTNTRECMLKIQEFKTNIMQLEQSVQEYQKNMTQINDLVSLFLLTDRKV